MMRFGASMAPTDPVLASDVQVEGPTLEGAVDEIDEDEVVEEVRITVWHEVAHYFGIDDDRLDELGYA